MMKKIYKALLRLTVLSSFFVYCVVCTVSLITHKNIQVVSSHKPIGIYILNGHGEDVPWTAGPLKAELLKALLDEPKPEHIFLTPDLWFAFCDYQDILFDLLQYAGITDPYTQIQVTDGKIEYLVDHVVDMGDSHELVEQQLALLLCFNADEWEFYDTHQGLYYLKRKDADSLGIKTDNCTRIENPEGYAQQTKERTPWVQTFISLCDEDACRQARGGRPLFVCVSGHGTPRIGGYAVEKLCGMYATQTWPLFEHLIYKLGVHTLYVHSCYWPVMRLREYMADCGAEQLPCMLISPIDKEKPSYFFNKIPEMVQYDPHTGAWEVNLNGKLSVYAALAEESLYAQADEAVLTDSLCKRLACMDVVEQNRLRGLKTSWLAPGSDMVLTA